MNSARFFLPVTSARKGYSIFRGPPGGLLPEAGRVSVPFHRPIQGGRLTLFGIGRRLPTIWRGRQQRPLRRSIAALEADDYKSRSLNRSMADSPSGSNTVPDREWAGLSSVAENPRGASGPAAAAFAVAVEPWCCGKSGRVY